MKDNFSKQAYEYAKYRPLYPPELYEFLLEQVDDTEWAWDCGTGNGQVAFELAKYFKYVGATDISTDQLRLSKPAINIVYYSFAAEYTLFLAETFDLITVGQAAHWFDLDAFYKEVDRVGKPRCVVAIWGYGLLNTENEAIQQLLQHFYTETVGEYWDAERQHIDNAYRDLPFPFEPIPAPEFSIHVEWNLEHLTGYLLTWSAVQKYMKANDGANPVDTLDSQLLTYWGDPEQVRSFTFPMFMKIGRKS